MICDCGNKQFHSRRENHKIIGVVCSSCKAFTPIKKKESKIKAPENKFKDIGENNEL